MANKGKVSTIRVAVCGLTSSSYNGLNGYGAGKSCLCNRFIRSPHDSFHMEHSSVLNLSEFGNNVINNSHFLYWGEKNITLENCQEINFQIVEHTEFIDDSCLKPFSATVPYCKRCTQLKLQCGGKIAYIEPNQITLPEQYTEVSKFPEKFAVKGYVVCVDVSTTFDDPENPQKEFLNHLLQNLQRTKKPVVIACTKFDRMKQASYDSVIEMMASFKKLQLQLVEVSAVKGINVDTCFLVLAHLVDSKNPKTKIISYADSKSLLDEYVRRSKQALQCVLDKRLTDFSMCVEDARARLIETTEYQILVGLLGSLKVRKLIKAKLGYLKEQTIKDKTTHFLEMLPHILYAMLPELELNVTLHAAKEILRNSKKFKNYFVHVENWKENTEFLQCNDLDHVPFDLLENEGKKILEKHMNEASSAARTEKIKDVLDKTILQDTSTSPTQLHVPCLHTDLSTVPQMVDMAKIWADLGLSKDANRLSMEQQLLIYNELMRKLQQKCAVELSELFLEQSSLFDRIMSSKEALDDVYDRVHKELKDMPRYKCFENWSEFRMSQVLKHIGNLQMPERSQVYRKSHLQDFIEKLADNGLLSRDKLNPCLQNESGLHWTFDPCASSINLSILARTQENAITLRSDFMNLFGGSRTVVIGEKRFEIVMSLHHGNSIDSLTSNEFVPHTAVAVVTSLECVDWLEDVVRRLWLPEGRAEKSCNLPSYRGMPLIMLALDKDATPSESNQPATSEIHSRAKEVSGLVQCVCMTETPTPQPKRLVVTSVIKDILLSIISSLSHLDEFFNSDLCHDDSTGLNIAVCTLEGDPYPNEELLNPFLKHQLVCYNKRNHTLFVKNVIKRHHQTTVLSFHSTFNGTVLCSSIHLGFILVYSTQRPASLAALKYLLPKLPNIPKMIVAMATTKSHNKELLEGQKLARDWDASFISNTGQELPIGFAVGFIQKCWLRRFSSWNTQNLPHDVISQKKLARALPSRPNEIVVEECVAYQPTQEAAHRPVQQPALPTPAQHEATSPLHTEGTTQPLDTEGAETSVYMHLFLNASELMTEESMEGYSELAEESMEGYSKLAEESMEDHSELTEGSTEEVYDHLNTSRLTEGSMEEGYSKLTEMENFEDDKDDDNGIIMNECPAYELPSRQAHGAVTTSKIDINVTSIETDTAKISNEENSIQEITNRKEDDMQEITTEGIYYDIL